MKLSDTYRNETVCNTLSTKQFPVIYDYNNIESSLTKALNKDKEEFSNMLKTLTKFMVASNSFIGIDLFKNRSEILSSI